MDVEKKTRLSDAILRSNCIDLAAAVKGNLSGKWVSTVFNIGQVMLSSSQNKDEAHTTFVWLLAKVILQITTISTIECHPARNILP